MVEFLLNDPRVDPNISCLIPTSNSTVLMNSFDYAMLARSDEKILEKLLNKMDFRNQSNTINSLHYVLTYNKGHLIKELVRRGGGH